MGHQIIKQPDGRLCVFSSVVGEVVIADATPEELADYYAADAAEKARKQIEKITEAVLADMPRTVYYRLAMTYEEAVAEHLRRGGNPGMVTTEERES